MDLRVTKQRAFALVATFVAFLTFIPQAVSDPVFHDEFHSSGNVGNGKYKYLLGLKERFPECGGLIDQYISMSDEIYALADQLHYTCCEARVQIGKQINELAKERSKVWRKVQDCVRDTTISKRKQRYLQGKAERSNRGTGSGGGDVFSTNGDKTKPPVDSEDPPFEPETPIEEIPMPPLPPLDGSVDVDATPYPELKPLPLPKLQPTPNYPTPKPTFLQGYISNDPTPTPTSDVSRTETPQPTESGTAEPTPDEEKKEDLKDKLCVFHYFYINGMNTPYEIPGAKRGDYREEYGLVYNHLVEYMQQHVDQAKQRHYMMPQTPNPSGLDPKKELEPVALSGCLLLTPEEDRWRCILPDVSNCIRSGNGFLEVGGKQYPGELPAGDMIEVLRQGVSLPGQGIDFSSQTSVVNDIVSRIQIVKERETQEGKERHFFIVSAHSQGNFFAEGVAWNLNNNHPELLPRLGIYSVGSPTDYGRVRDLLVNGALKTSTRHDDLILTLNKPLNLALGPLESLQNKFGNAVGDLLRNLHIATNPAPANLPALHPNREALFNTFRSGTPDASFKNAIRDCVAKSKGTLAPKDPPPEGMTIPLLDSHLMTNYLNPAPPSGGTPVLGEMQGRLVELTRALCPNVE